MLTNSSLALKKNVLTFQIGYVGIDCLVSVKVVPGSTCSQKLREDRTERALVLISRKVNGARWLFLSSLLRSSRMNMPCIIILSSFDLCCDFFRFNRWKRLFFAPMRSFLQFCDSCCSLLHSLVGASFITF